MTHWIKWGGRNDRRDDRPAGRTAGAAAPTAAHAAPDVEAESAWSCGWFESSLELSQGLAVFEHDDADLAHAVRQMLRPVRPQPFNH